MIDHKALKSVSSEIFFYNNDKQNSSVRAHVGMGSCARPCTLHSIVICVMYMSLVILHVIGDVDITVIVKDTVLDAYKVCAPRSLLVLFRLPSLLRIRRDQQVTSDYLWWSVILPLSF